MAEAEVITKEKILYAIENKDIRFDKSPDGEEPVCMIGIWWFYFSGNMSYEEFLTLSKEEKGTEVYNVLKNEITAEEQGLGEDEYKYYICVLRSYINESVYKKIIA